MSAIFLSSLIIFNFIQHCDYVGWSENNEITDHLWFPNTWKPGLHQPYGPLDPKANFTLLLVELLNFHWKVKYSNNEKLIDPVQNANNLYMHCCFHVFSQEMTLKNWINSLMEIKIMTMETWKWKLGLRVSYSSVFLSNLWTWPHQAWRTKQTKLTYLVQICHP